MFILSRVFYSRGLKTVYELCSPVAYPHSFLHLTLLRTLVCSRNETQRTTKLICKFNEYAGSRSRRRRGSCRKKTKQRVLPPPTLTTLPHPHIEALTHDSQLAEKELTLGAASHRSSSTHLSTSSATVTVRPVPPNPTLGPLECSDFNE